MAIDPHQVERETLQAVAIEMREFIRGIYPDDSLASGNWPDVKRLVKRWDAALRASSPRVETETGWRDISTAPKDGTKVLAIHEEGHDICWYDEGHGDGIDDMGHDAGWFGVIYAAPGRSFGNPKYHREAQGQPTHWMPLPSPPETAHE